MAELENFEQLERQIQTLLARTVKAGPQEPLARVAADLVHVPRPEFRARLAENLKRRATMASASQKPSEVTVQPPRGFRTVNVYLAVTQVEGLLGFLKSAFGAEELFRTPMPGGGLHAELRLGDTMVMAGGNRGTPCPVAMHLYVQDADAVYQRAIAAGATPLYPMTDQPYGDREGGVTDLCGNYWYIATHRPTGHRPANMHDVTPTLHAQNAEALLNFMRSALHAENVEITRLPDGAVQHAQMRIGDSIVEVGPASGKIAPTAAVMILYVTDVDRAYQHALAAGAKPIEPPANQPYGERRGGVSDGHGNSWYFSGPLANPS